ncbi:MAG TPA: serine/threonine-protein kinase [Enhygromyxa sp.]|nr:serine/threonine-protein kinase [Enhygromyxa sp.]
MNTAVKYKHNDRLERGEVIASRYVVEQPWREHPLGELYLCRDLTCGDLVTLHRLRREFADPGVGDRLLDSRARATLGSPLLPDIIDYGADFDGRPFLVCRSHEAITLAELERPIDFCDAVAIVEQIASALIPAHGERLVHGGIEPSSVLIERDEHGRPQVVGLLAFGLVPALGGADSKSRSLPLLMSPAHVAPELIRGARISPAADVYALGILLWELIHGAPPFRGPTLRVLDAHQRRALPDVQLPSEVPSALDFVLRRMLAKNPVDRFADAAAVAEQLRGLSDDAIPDLTLELDPDPEPKTRRAIDDEDDERTILFDRRQPEPSPSASRSATAVVVQDSPLPSSLPRPARAKWVAIATIAAAGMLVVLQALAGTPVESVAEAPRELVDEATPLVVGTPVTEQSSESSESNESSESSSTVHPDAVPPRRLVPEQLAPAEFRERRSMLHSGVARHCAGQPVRNVEVAVRVGPSGEVDSATVLGSAATTGVGACVERQSRQLQFPVTERGGYYIYTLR